jgi:hypothetical protein
MAVLVSHLIISQTDHGKNTTVLNHPNWKTFPVRRLSVSIEQLKSWNLLSILTPRRPSSGSPIEKSLEDVDCTMLYLEFENTVAKDRFSSKLLDALRRRRNQLAAYTKSREEAMRRAERPNRIRSPDRNTSQLRISTVDRTSSLGLVLPEIECHSTISLGTVINASSSQRPFSKHKVCGAQLIHPPI